MVDTVKLHSVVVAGADEGHETANMIGRGVRLQRDFDGAEVGLQDGGIVDRFTVRRGEADFVPILLDGAKEFEGRLARGGLIGRHVGEIGRIVGGADGGGERMIKRVVDGRHGVDRLRDDRFRRRRVRFGFGFGCLRFHFDGFGASGLAGLPPPQPINPSTAAARMLRAPARRVVQSAIAFSLPIADQGFQPPPRGGTLV